MRQRKCKGFQKVTPSLMLVVMLIGLGVALSGCKENVSPSSTLHHDFTNQDYVKILEQRLSDLPLNSQVAVGLVHNGRTEFLGITNDNEVLKRVDNADRIFEIGSITKVFAGICLSELIASNQASLTESLQNQFDFPLQAGGDISLLQLANHTSGLPRLPTNTEEVEGLDLEDPYALYTYEHLKSYLQHHVVLQAPSGSKYEYSNLGMGILGYVLAQKRQTTFEDMLQDIVCKPLGMNSTTTLLENVDPSLLVEARDIEGNVVSHWNFAETMSAAGSIKSSVIDMISFIEKNFENDVVYNLPQEKTFDKGDNFHMGLGWSIYEADGFTVHTHDGGTGGFSSILMLDKGKQIGVIVLSNIEDYHSSIVPMCNDFLLKISE